MTHKQIFSAVFFGALLAVTGLARMAFADVSDAVWEAMKDKSITIVFKDFKQVTGTLTKITQTEIVLILENDVVQSYSRTDVEQVKAAKNDTKTEAPSSKPKDLAPLCSLYSGGEIELVESKGLAAFGATDANKVIQGMAQSLGMRAVPVAYESNVANAAATYKEGKPIIVFNRKFMDDLSRTVGTEWTYTAVMAHELGHHMNFHLAARSNSDSTADNWKQELEADYFMGFALGKMGATLEQAQSAMKGLELMYGGTASKSHPASKDRLAGTRSGFCDAIGGCSATTPKATPSPTPTPTPTPSTPKPETTYPGLLSGKVTGSTYSNELYYSNYFFPKELIAEGWDKGYNITNLYYSIKDMKWHVSMSSGTGWTQSYKKSSSWPETYIKQYTDKGYYITSMSYHSEWIIVMSKYTKTSEQQIIFTDDFPDSKIQEYYNSGYRIGLVSYGLNGVAPSWSGWVVTMEKGKYSAQQTYKKSEKFPTVFIEEKWKEGFAVTAIHYADKQWVVVMTKNSGLNNQFFSLADNIKLNWSIGLNITSINSIDEKIYFVFSNQPKQEIKSSTPGPVTASPVVILQLNNWKPTASDISSYIKQAISNTKLSKILISEFNKKGVLPISASSYTIDQCIDEGNCDNTSVDVIEWNNRRWVRFHEETSFTTFTVKTYEITNNVLSKKCELINYEEDYMTGCFENTKISPCTALKDDWSSMPKKMKDFVCSQDKI